VPRRPPVAAFLLAAVLSGCADVPDTSDWASVSPVEGLPVKTLQVCHAFKRALPDSLTAGVERVDVKPVSDTTSGYGDPLITVRCGVAEGSERDEPFTINEVQWAMHDTGATRTWTTRAESVNVEVVIPDAYASQAEIVGTVAFQVAKLP
jgi:hypothetical protein